VGIVVYLVTDWYLPRCMV